MAAPANTGNCPGSSTLTRYRTYHPTCLKLVLVCAFLFASTISPLQAFSQPQTTTPTAMDTLLPTALGSWRSTGAPVLYQGKGIFDYMDGAGEVYRTYEYRYLLVQRYASPDREEILVELFDMGSPRNAFGVFTCVQGRGPAVEIGQDAEFKNGLLCLWKGRYFVYIQTDGENDEVREAVFGLGRMIADAIQESGTRPPLLQCLPEGEYLPGTLRYFFHPAILDSHFPIGDGNPLLVGAGTEGVLVRLKNGKSHLLVMRYEEQELLDSAKRAFTSARLPGSEQGGIYATHAAPITVCARVGAYLIVVFDSPTRQLATDIVETVKRRLP